MCENLLHVFREEWDRIRADPHRFFVAHGHEEPLIGRVVERSERFWVIERDDEIAREIAERTDPLKNPLPGLE